MKNIKQLLSTTVLLSFFLFQTGCAVTSSTKVIQPSKTNTLPQSLAYQLNIKLNDLPIPRTYLNRMIKMVKINLKKQDMTLNKDGQYDLNIKFLDFNMRSDLTRTMFGIFAGSDHVTTLVTLTNAAGETLAEGEVYASAKATAGGESQIAIKYSEELSDFLAGKRN
jgi:hypothetical protein